MEMDLRDRKDYLKKWRQKQPKDYWKKYYKNRKQKIAGKCEICNADIYFPSKKFCSRKCFKKSMIGHNRGFQKGQKVSHTKKTKEKIRQSMLKQYREGKRENIFKRKGKNHPNWKGGRRIVKGYVYIYEPSNPRGCVAEHRIVMEKILGRKLESWEHVHHKNRKRNDNRPENLLLVTRKTHKTKEGKRRVNCPFCNNEFGLE